MRRVALLSWMISSALSCPGGETLEHSSARTVRALAGSFNHVQGIDVEGDTLWVSSVDRSSSRGLLSRVNLRSGRVEKQVEVQNEKRFHPGGISLEDGWIWVPVAEYRRGGTSMIQKWDKKTLELVSSFEVDDHIGCVAVGPRQIVGGNWDAVDLYFWTRDGKQLRKVRNTHGNRYQDLKWMGGKLVASGIVQAVPSQSGAIDWLNPETLELQRRVTAGKTDRGTVLTNEGMTLRDGKLYLLPEDDPSRLFVFDLK